MTANAASDPNYPSAIVSVSPTSGYASGGNTVIVSGINFDQDTYVKVANNTVPTTFNSSTELSIVMPSSSPGFVSVAVFDGSVGAVLSNAYEYVPDPAPAPAPAPAPVAVSQPIAASSPEVVQVQPSPTPEPIVEEASEEVVQQEDKATYLSDNAYVVVDENNIENLVIKTFFDVPQKFILRQRVDERWIYVDKSYYFNGNVVFLDTNLELGSTYKVIVEIKDKKTIVAWFTVLEKEYTVN